MISMKKMIISNNLWPNKQSIFVSMWIFHVFVLLFVWLICSQLNGFIADIKEIVYAGHILKTNSLYQLGSYMLIMVCIAYQCVFNTFASSIKNQVRHLLCFFFFVLIIVYFAPIIHGQFTGHVAVWFIQHQ